MKSHFIRLFKYDRHANRQIVDLIIQHSAVGKPVQLMAHLFAAQQIWLNRVKELPAANVALWPDWQADEFTRLTALNADGWLTYLETLQESDFNKVISYINFQGHQFEYALSDILTHVINHGTHHRAQAGQHLKMLGIEQLPISDYIYFLKDPQ